MGGVSLDLDPSVGARSCQTTADSCQRPPGALPRLDLLRMAKARKFPLLPFRAGWFARHRPDIPEVSTRCKGRPGPVSATALVLGRRRHQHASVERFTHRTRRWNRAPFSWKGAASAYAAPPAARLSTHRGWVESVPPAFWGPPPGWAPCTLAPRLGRRGGCAERAAGRVAAPGQPADRMCRRRHRGCPTAGRRSTQTNRTRASLRASRMRCASDYHRGQRVLLEPQDRTGQRKGRHNVKVIRASYGWPTTRASAADDRSASHAGHGRTATGRGPLEPSTGSTSAYATASSKLIARPSSRASSSSGSTGICGTGTSP
jgi:hypothetical protein